MKPYPCTFAALALAIAAALAAAPVHAADAAAGAAAAASADATAAGEARDATTLDAVSVIGLGETRQVQRVKLADIEKTVAGTSPQKILNKLPGISVQSNDAYGANEESQTISLRGFNQRLLGYTLDGIPLGDNSYGNYNGLGISRALIGENLAGAELAAGIGSLGTASTSNLGGTLQYFSADPEAEFGLRVAQTFGSDSTRRTYARLDTGEHGGFSMYLSGSLLSADMWSRPHDNQDQNQVNLKALYTFGDGNRISAFVSSAETSQANYAYLSKALLARGADWDWNLYKPDWQRALNAAYCAPKPWPANKAGDRRCKFESPAATIDDAYYASRALRTDHLAALAGEFNLGEGLRLNAQTYYHDDRGQGHWWSPGNWSYPGTAKEIPISIRSTNYGINRYGAMASLNWEVGIHRIQGGFWYESNHHDVQRNFYFIEGPIDDDRFLNDPDRRLFFQKYRINTRQAYLQDTMSLLDGRLTVDVGAKSTQVDMRATQVPSKMMEVPNASGRLETKDSFLPQLGVGYKLGEGRELFAAYTENVAAFVGGGAGGPLAIGQAAFDAQKADLKPEESKTLEAGYRQVGETYQASLSVYKVRFDNRLLSLNPCSSIEAGTRPECITKFFNVGSVDSYGSELVFIWRPVDGLQWYNALSWNKSTYQDNYIDGGKTVPTSGKRVVDVPDTMFSSEVSYSRGPWLASVSGKYTGKRYYTYLNDNGFGGYTTFDAALRYTFDAMGPLRQWSVSLNASNLTDKRTASNLTAFNASDPQGKTYAFHANAPRQLFLTLDARF
ncbi:TonB-dependent receptor [Lysobacter enzymogenes]|uniref:TonB-dependent receptor n=1 Tax=Lysobacter enzymogenes TaxID=69 RepID=A0A0S2DKK0_LYSEN|nr:TonB-dependent receptor [Lysobacter enzymogenes]ALN59082.1 TonB-dependent receptor [Lysobacter enzymogenes]QCW27318.1 TonB-dependent receptor [Lysobacter enzymogenes]